MLTLSGTASVAAYETALRAVTYENTDANPTAATRTVSFQATDTAAAPSNVATRDIAIGPVNDKPVVTTTGGTTAYTENAAAVTVDGGLTATDVDDANLESLTVEIASGLQPGDALTFAPGPLSGGYVPGTGILTLSGSLRSARTQTVLRSVAFSSTNNDPTTSRTIWFTVTTATSTATSGRRASPSHPSTTRRSPSTTARRWPRTRRDRGRRADERHRRRRGAEVDRVRTQPANGAVVITGGGTGLTYAPNANYCNWPPGRAPTRSPTR